MYFIRLLRLVLRFILLLVGDIEVVGLENLPRSGGYIVAPNHLSKADAPLVFLALPIPPVQIHYFAGEKWGRHVIYGPLLRRSNAISINRGEVDRRALKEALQTLKSGRVFGLAPEGTRSRTGGLIRAKDGAAYIASRADVPIVPCAVTGTEVLGRNVLRLRRTRMKVVFGQAFTLPDLGAKVRSPDLAAYSHLIMVKIAELLPERYRGYYANSPALAALGRGEDPFPYCLEAERTNTIT